MSPINGIDYAFDPHPSPAALKASGFEFVARYISNVPANDSNGKNLQAAELKALRAEGLSLVMVFETAADRMLSGEPGGLADARDALAVVNVLGMEGVPVYFACDFDATPAQQGPINAYLSACATVLGQARVGIYGGYYPVSRAMAAGKARWGWQTLAWSGGLWWQGAQIRQITSATEIDGASCDRDVAEYPNYGQWPLYVAPAPVPAPVQAEAYTLTVPRLASGSKGSPVGSVQSLAGPKRNKPLAIDDDFGPDTETLVKEAQAAGKLPQTGVVDEATWKFLLGL